MGVPGTQPKQTSPDRRRPRRAVDMRGYLIRDDGIRHVIKLTDLNYGGCGVQAPVQLAVGETVEVSVLSRGSIAAEVRWYADGKAGLVFEPIAEEVGKQVERRAGRVEVPGEIGLKAMGRSTYRVRVLDLSTDGCKVELVERPSVGDVMLVKFDGIETMEAEAAWVDGYTAGLRFQHRIHPAVLELMLQRLSAA
jgi:hypothetical protein